MLARVHIAKKELGLSGEEYDAALERFGASSAADLEVDQLGELDRYFQSLGWQPKPKRSETDAYYIYLEKWKARAGERPGMATPEQLALIDILWDKLAWWWNKDGRGKRDTALRGFLQRQCGVSFLEFVKFKKEEEDRYSGAHEFIEALKKIGSRK